MKKSILIIFLLLILLPSAFAKFNYSEVGIDDFNLGRGQFNTDSAIVSSATRTISTPVQSPLVADMDNNSINEIIVQDGDIMRVYQNKELDINDTFNIGITDTDEISNFIIFDIDGDGRHEYIVASEEDQHIFIMDYNGTTITQTSINFSNLTHTATSGGADAGETIIKCESVNRCLMVYSDFAQTQVGNTNQLSATAFNSTDLMGTEIVLDVGGAGLFRGYCMPKVRTMPNKDIDNDGVNEFVSSVLTTTSGSSAPNVSVYIISINSSNQAILENEFDDENIFVFDTFAGSTDCESNNAQKHFTAPFVFDIDGGSSNGLEIVIGMMTATDEYKMFSYNSDTSFLDDYPEIQTSDGQIVSNVFLANAFTDTGLVDFCIAGFKNSTDEFDVTCASEQTGDTPETVEFIMDTSGLYNITQSFWELNVMTHSGQQSTATVDGTDLSEIINSYGVSELSRTGTLCGISAICELNLLFENPKGDSVLITNDAEQNGRDDIILMTSTNVWYLDDGFSTSGAKISSYFVNPCIDQTIQLNSTMEVRITPTDVDGDSVSARAVLYFGEGNDSQDSNWTSTASSGTTFSFSFNVNKSTSFSTLRLFANDTSDPTDIDTIDLTYSVNTNGVEFGECSTSVTVDTNETNETFVVSEAERDSLKDEIMGVTGIESRFSPLIGILFIMVAIWFTITLLTENGVKDGMVLMYLPMLAGFVTWILFVWLTFISAWTVVVGILFAGAFIGFKVYRNNQVSGGGF